MCDKCLNVPTREAQATRRSLSEYISPAAFQAQRREVERLTSHVTELETLMKGRERFIASLTHDVIDGQEHINLRERAIRYLVKQFVEPSKQGMALAFAEGILGVPEGGLDDIDVRPKRDIAQDRDTRRPGTERGVGAGVSGAAPLQNCA